MPILTADDGLVAKTPEEQQTLQGAGYQQCYGKFSNKGPQSPSRPCDYHIAPEAQTHVQDKGGYYTCPRCQQSHDLMHDLPWHGASEDDFNQDSFSAGGGTRIGLSLKEQAQIGEDLVENLGELPGYGPITWVHPGGSISQSPLDMATKEWGIEVKTLGYDATHHRFVPGRPKEKEDKNAMALARGLKGVLGILVILDYRRSVADIYAREFPVDPATGKGVGAFRSLNAQHLLAEVPFKNPFMQPEHPAPHGPNTVPREGSQEDWGF
jgi:hypothetical protein